MRTERTVDDINSALLTLRTLHYGNYGTFLIMGNAGFISSTVFWSFQADPPEAQWLLWAFGGRIGAALLQLWQ